MLACFLIYIFEPIGFKYLIELLLNFLAVFIFSNWKFHITQSDKLWNIEFLSNEFIDKLQENSQELEISK